MNATSTRIRTRKESPMRTSRSIVSLALFAGTALLLAAQPAVGAEILRHQYFANSGLTDVIGPRDGALGSTATLVAPVGITPGYVNLPGGSGGGNYGSHVLFPTSALLDELNSEGDTTIVRTNKVDLSRVYRNLAKDAAEEIKELVYAYNSYQAQPVQTAGFDGGFVSGSGGYYRYPYYPPYGP